MHRAAKSHEMQLHELAECIIADEEFGWLGSVETGARTVSIGVQVVKLEGGTADAWVVQAEIPPAPHRMHFEYEGRRWSELYRYAEGRTATSEVHGELPLMSFAETLEEG